VKSDISIAIYNEFTKHGIEIPFPQQDIYIKDMPKTETKSLGDKTSNASE
jgi:small-conductance mechanosensitive channel